MMLQTLKLLPLLQLLLDKNLVFRTVDDAAEARLKIASNGDISFYEDTGSTARLFWDASAESLGTGTTSPTSKLHVKDIANNGCNSCRVW